MAAVRSASLLSGDARRAWLAVGTVCIGAFMGQLDASIVTVALPTLAADFHAPLGAVEWVVLAYVLVLVAAIVLVGRLADRAGRRTLYLAGFAVFVVGSAACAVAPSLGLLIAARVLQGGGAVLLQANSVALIADVMPPDRIGAGIGVQGAAQAVGLAVGPSAGGALIALAGWRAIFLINIPAGILGIAAGLLLLPRDASHRSLPASRIDIPATAAFALAAGSAVALLSLAAVPGEPAWLFAALGLAAVTGAATAWSRQRRRPDALIENDLLRRRPFLTGGAAALLSYGTLFGLLLLVPFLVEASGGGALRAGLELTVLPVALGLAAPFGGRLADRHGARLPAVAGMAMAAAALAALAIAPGSTPIRLVALAVGGAGQGLFIPAMNASVMRAAPAGRTGAAAGAVNLVRSAGTALGVAAAGVALALSGPRAGFALLAAFAASAGLIAAVRRPARSLS
ncbi:MAG: MFS transporter [Candidatus Dormibacteraeota bacterium]|nr:MFS transporter [Candidatus Dormibacteraeota bacterium]